MLRGLGCSVAVALAIALCPSSVQACSAWPECSSPAGTIPHDGAVGVPLNAELEAYVYWADHRESIPVTLRVAETGAAVPLEAASTPGRFRTLAPLESATRYELLGPAQARTAEHTTECAATTSVLATFTTGAEVDTVAPSTPSTTSHGCRVETCDSSACCGPYVAAISAASWHADDEGGFPVSYAYGSPSGPRTELERGTAARFLVGIGRIGGLSGYLIEAGGPVYAIDIAGNVSAEGGDYTLDLSCTPSEPPRDAGPAMPPLDASATPDASAPHADAGPSGGMSSGCACALGPRDAQSGAWLVPLLLAVLVYRRRAAA